MNSDYKSIGRLTNPYLLHGYQFQHKLKNPQKHISAVANNACSVTEVKKRQARLVLGWVTARED